MKVHCPRCDRRIAEFARVEKVGVQMTVCRYCNIQAHDSYEHKNGNDYWDVHFEQTQKRAMDRLGSQGF
jgi:ribosome-binding protein aMBF1 (putative translation factor)